MSLKRPFVPKSDVKQWFTTTTTTLQYFETIAVFIHSLILANHCNVLLGTRWAFINIYILLGDCRVMCMWGDGQLHLSSCLLPVRPDRARWGWWGGTDPDHADRWPTSDPTGRVHVATGKRWVNPDNSEIFVYKPWRAKVFFQLEIIVNMINALVSSFRFIWRSSLDVRFWRLKTHRKH